MERTLSEKAALHLCLLSVTKEAGFTSPLRKECAGRLARREAVPEEFSDLFGKVGGGPFEAARRMLGDALQAGVRIVSVLDEEYPFALRLTDDPPLVLYVEGSLPQWSQEGATKCFAAIVGTRRPTSYGQNTAFRIARELTERGVSVVSGLASGIDTAAHRGAVEGVRRLQNGAGVKGSAGLAVLGSGLRYVYPRDNEKLVREIIESGGAVVSEYSINQSPKPYYFPERNRIVAGLCAATIVVEAGERSGAAITARLAAEEGREVFAVPGPIDAPRSSGTNRLLRDGARPYTELDDVLPFLACGSVKSAKREPQGPPAVTTAESRILEALEEKDGRSAEELSSVLGVSFPEMQVQLTEMELRRRIFRTINGSYSLRQPLF